MRKSLLLPAFVFVLALTPVPVEATEKASERVSSFAGSFSQVLPIEVPAFRGLEPKLALSYSSEARNGFVGVGWSLAGVSVIERLSPTRGTPLFTWEDKWYLNGQKMFWCGAGITAASCAAGGTHYAEDENYVVDPAHEGRSQPLRRLAGPRRSLRLSHVHARRVG
ncbi:MAG: hypothetical protein KJ067_24270 [Vicinamibacteria bacterium]|nr:hypothetical protein [Vicinamibacteria bacterium]